MGQGAVEIQRLERQRVRRPVSAVPSSIVRRRPIAPGAVLMPSFVVGAMSTAAVVDTWASVGSCAQIGRNGLSGGSASAGAGADGPPDHHRGRCFIGARSEVVEGCIVREGSVLAWASSSASRPGSSFAPPAKSSMAKSANSVVVAGSMPGKSPAERQAGQDPIAPLSSSVDRERSKPRSTNFSIDPSQRSIPLCGESEIVYPGARLRSNFGSNPLAT